MKILLVSSPGSRKFEVQEVAGIRAPPLGLAYIAAVLELHGHKVKILDAASLDMSINDIVKTILSEKPDILGISALTPSVKTGYAIASKVKEHYPDLPVVMGGPHVSFMYEEALNHDVDYVVIGEGEYTMLELAKYIEKGDGNLRDIRGIAFRDDTGRIIVTPQRPFIKNLDELPFPACHLLPMDRYTWLGKPIKIIHVIASRGCPYGCIYCVTSYLWGRRYRIRSPSLVADEIEYAINKYKTRTIIFTDDELTLIPRWIHEFINEIKSRGLDIEWSCSSRVSSVTGDMLREMARHGCKTIYYGIESYRDEDYDRIGKRITRRQVEKAIELTKREGINAVGSFILGFPWHTIDDMKNIVRFADRLEPDYAQFSIATPYPGTPLYYMAKEQGLIEVHDWDYYTAAYPVMRGWSFTREQVAELLVWAYKYFYLKPRRLIMNFIKGRIGTVIGVTARALKSYIRRMFGLK